MTFSSHLPHLLTALEVLAQTQAVNMPEAITYFDMARMVRARLPERIDLVHHTYQLEINWQFAMVKYKDSWSGPKTSGVKKTKEKQLYPERFEEDVKKNFPGLAESMFKYTIKPSNGPTPPGPAHTRETGRGYDLPPPPEAPARHRRRMFDPPASHLRSHQQSNPIYLTKSCIETWGKSIGIRLGNSNQNWWIRVHCMLHGHVLPMRREEYNWCKANWSKAEFNKVTLPPPSIQLALVGPEWCVVVMDRNQLTVSTLIIITKALILISNRFPTLSMPQLSRRVLFKESNTGGILDTPLVQSILSSHFSPRSPIILLDGAARPRISTPI